MTAQIQKRLAKSELCMYADAEATKDHTGANEMFVAASNDTVRLSCVSLSSQLEPYMKEFRENLTFFGTILRLLKLRIVS